MWNYLKKFLVEKALGKFVIESEEEYDTIDNNSTIDPTNQSIHLENVKLNLNWINSKLKNYPLTALLSCSSASIQEIGVNINWYEIFRYWTQVKTKFHIDTDSNEEEEDEKSCASCSLIQISNIQLILTRIPNTNNNPRIDQDDSTIEELVQDCVQIKKEFSVDLMTDFVNHVIGQFKVKIDGIQVKIVNSDEGEVVDISMPETIIEPEVNGIRRIKLVNEPLELFSESLSCTLHKGTEFTFTRSIEDSSLKISIPKVNCKIGSLDQLSSLFPASTNDIEASKTKLSLSIDIDLVELEIGINQFKCYFHDFSIDESKQFIIGHFGMKWMNHLIIESSIQSHCIAGSLSDILGIKIDDEISIRFSNWKQLNDIMDFFTLNSTKSSGFRPKMEFTFKVNMIKLNIEAFSFDLDTLELTHKEMNLKRICFNYLNCQILLDDLEYIKTQSSSSKSNFSFDPFSELVRFIENEKIICVTEKNLLYSKLQNQLVHELSIKEISGSINFGDMLKYMKTTKDSESSINSTMILSGIMLKIENLSLKIELEDNIYAVQLKNISSLLTSDFFDLRISESTIVRNMMPISGSSTVAFTLDYKRNICAFDVSGLQISFPYDFYEGLKQDILMLMNNLSFSKNSTNSKNIKWNGKINRSNIVVIAPIEELIRSKVLIEEITIIKQPADNTIIFIDNAELQILERSIFQSGLIKVSLDPISEKVCLDNYSSILNLTSNDLGNLMKFCEFWTEIYSPIIPFVEPKVIFHHNLHDEHLIETADENVSIHLNDGSIELEFDLSDSEEEEATVVIEPSETSMNIEDMMAEVEADYFITKTPKESSSGPTIQINDVSLKVNLILSEKETVEISFTGIQGKITVDCFDLNVKEGIMVKSESFDETVVKKKLIVNRWMRGPDANCPVENSNFASFKSSRVRNNDIDTVIDGINEFNLICSMCPLRLFLDQRLLNALYEFFPSTTLESSSSSSSTTTAVMRGYVFFNTVSISPMALKMDYKAGSSASIPLEGAEMILPRVQLRGIKGFQGLGPAVMSAWVPQLKGKKLTGILRTGLVPVRTIVNLSGGMTEILLLPWQLTGDGGGRTVAQTAAHLRRSSKLIGLETLKLTATLAEQTTKLLKTTSRESDRTCPLDFQSGVQQAAQLIIALPTRLTRQNQKKGTFRAVPLFVLDSAATATGALTKTLQGLQAQFDRDTRNDQRQKQNKQP